MALPKNPKADLKRKYKRILELSFILSIVLLIAAFKVFPDPQKVQLKLDGPPVIIKGEDVERTKQELPPPPPPKPPIPIDAPSDEVLEDIPFEETVIDENANVPPPPPLAADNDNYVEDEIFIAVEEMPEPVGGMSSILKKLNYPEIAKRAGVQGKVTIRVVVNEEGNVEDVELVKGIGAGCDEEAMRAVRETKFKPGKQRGRAVKVYVTIPIKFELN